MLIESIAVAAAPFGVSDEGANVQLAPEGSPLQERFTV